MKWYIIVALSDLVRWLKRRWDYDTDMIDVLDMVKDYEKTQANKR